MREVLLLYGTAFTSELLHNRCHVDRISANHSIGDQVETQGLMREVRRALPSELAFVGHHQEGAQIMQGLAFIELSGDAATVLRLGIPPQQTAS
jgi:hypothetical protein